MGRYEKRRRRRRRRMKRGKVGQRDD